MFFVVFPDPIAAGLVVADQHDAGGWVAREEAVVRPGLEGDPAHDLLVAVELDQVCLARGVACEGARAALAAAFEGDDALAVEGRRRVFTPRRGRDQLALRDLR